MRMSAIARRKADQGRHSRRRKVVLIDGIDPDVGAICSDDLGLSASHDRDCFVAALLAMTPMIARPTLRSRRHRSFTTPSAASAAIHASE